MIVMIERVWAQLKSYMEYASSQKETPYQLSKLAASLGDISLKIGKKNRFIEILDIFSHKSNHDVRYLIFTFVYVLKTITLSHRYYFIDFLFFRVLRKFICITSSNKEVYSIYPNFQNVILKVMTEMSCIIRKCYCLANKSTPPENEMTLLNLVLLDINNKIKNTNIYDFSK